jgi:flagellar hook assembly protein FlgD
VLERRGADACRLLNARVSASRAGASGIAAISFDVTTAASVTASVAGVQGLVMRRLERGRAAAAGSVTLLWDGRDDRGISVPAGAYSVVISARTDNGDAARLIVPVMVTR